MCGIPRHSVSMRLTRPRTMPALRPGTRNSRQPRSRPNASALTGKPQPRPGSGRCGGRGQGRSRGGSRDRVTEPDPIAALAAQLEELRGQLARYTGETGHLRARLNEDSGQVLMLRLEIKQLGEKIEAAIARRNADEPPAPYWLGLSKEEHARPARRAARVGRSRRPGPVSGLLREAAALLAQPPGGRDRAQQRDDRVEPRVRRSRRTGTCRTRSGLPRALAARCPVPPAAAVKCDVAGCSRRCRSRGSARRPATPDRPRRPRPRFPGVRGLLRARWRH